mgnify:CR=1 FL=1
MFTEIPFELALILVIVELAGAPIIIALSLAFTGWTCQKIDDYREHRSADGGAGWSGRHAGSRYATRRREIRRSLPGLPGGFVVKL